ncbi:WD40 repeat-like protein [Dichomitus squalens LYAD-421 SS1]|uniref:WD40 repeat-like protein n=1 Tax=Dichomitus squalens (strain LYAD-421) TaxID=732165 RepID=UPI000441463C|nr:WD40 repeat-like protein [Dichomitus squalens LYAD-421 SS1]EJF65583.1 WD40 repeat-like protein [Dichomitus squalens LYAD-421 SS1]
MSNHAHLKSKEQALAFYELLRTETGLRLREHIRSLTSSPLDVLQFPPMQLLPNLSALAFHHSQTPGIPRWEATYFMSSHGASPVLSPMRSDVDGGVRLLLLDCARCTVQALMLTGLDVSRSFSEPSEWKRLQTHTIGLDLGWMADIAAIGHEKRVHALVVSPDGNWFASGSEDNTIILWDSDGQLCHEWMAHYGYIRSLVFSPDSGFLASAGGDGKVVVWDLNQDARRVGTLEGHTVHVHDCAWSPDGTTIASGAYDTTLRLWDTDIQAASSLGWRAR